MIYIVYIIYKGNTGMFLKSVVINLKFLKDKSVEFVGPILLLCLISPSRNI